MLVKELKFEFEYLIFVFYLLFENIFLKFGKIYKILNFLFLDF